MIDSPENELLHRARCGDRDAENELVARYEPVHRYHARRSQGSPEEDEVLQAARVSTWKAIQKYDDTRGMKFSTFVAQQSGFYSRNASRPTVKERRTHVLDERMDFASEADPERDALRGQLVANLTELVGRSAEMDALDRDIFHRRLVSESPVDRQVLATAHDVSRQAVRKRELKLLGEVLPRVLKSLRDAA